MLIKGRKIKELTKLKQKERTENKEDENIMKRNKSGISLITLVITIIIMTIIAGAIIVSLAEGNIFDKAQDAVGKYNKNQQQTANSLKWLDWYKYVSEITEEGVPIPKGFVKSPYDGENTKDGGLVIYALDPEEIKKGVKDIKAKDGSHKVSLETRNQFVWVPVEDFKNDFVRDGFGRSLGSAPTSGYWELELDEDNMPNETQNSSYISDRTSAEAKEMYASVKEYGGFYIARYEVGYYDDEDELSITMGKYPRANVRWGLTRIEENRNENAVFFARNFYPKDNNNYGVVSTLTYGVQWDTTLNWWKKIDPEFNLEDSTNYGNYWNTAILIDEYNADAEYSGRNDVYWYDVKAKKDGDEWLLTTGAFKKAKVNNIYDMAGNLWEWTMEGYLDIYSAVRGGSFFEFDGYDPVMDRFYEYTKTPTFDMGFRPSLYIKVDN